MAFEGLTEKLNGVFKKLSGRGYLKEADINEAMREVRLALLEADVNFKVARDFIKAVTAEAVGEEVLKSLTPGQQVIKIVHAALIATMGGAHQKLQVASQPPSVILLCGLQGAGKTTFAAKLAKWLKKQGKKPLLAACDVARPAAIEQLQIVGKSVDTPVFTLPGEAPRQIAQKAVAHARRELYDTVILDTAGRTHIDDALMEEIGAVAAATRPIETLLVVDAMTGQEAVNIAESFRAALPLSGIVLTKLDGDTRGGAALSMRAVTGVPIKFCSVGETMGDIEPFHPDRMASRILGMGDVLTVIEKAQETFDAEKAQKLGERMRRNELTLNDYLEQMQQMRQMGGIGAVMGMLPGNNRAAFDEEAAEHQIRQTTAIIHSMTERERLRPEIINASRRRRIAAGSGTQVSDVNRLINQFDNVKRMMRSLSGKHHKKGRLGGFKMPF